jgi:hypothetical protein
MVLAAPFCGVKEHELAEFFFIQTGVFNDIARKKHLSR